MVQAEEEQGIENGRDDAALQQLPILLGSKKPEGFQVLALKKMPRQNPSGLFIKLCIVLLVFHPAIISISLHEGQKHLIQLVYHPHLHRHHFRAARNVPGVDGNIAQIV